MKIIIQHLRFPHPRYWQHPAMTDITFPDFESARAGVLAHKGKAQRRVDPYPNELAARASRDERISIIEE